MNGILLVNKPVGITSRDVVNRVCKILGTKKIGHTGTLDPLASGVLVLCIGNATKLVEILTSNDKEYEAEVTLGIETDTYDITGNIIRKENVIKKEREIQTALNSMLGTYSQEVPIYSAVKINGKKLYEYARNKEYVELPKRDVTIKEILLLNIDNTKFTFRTTVSKGTYIRSLICDIANKLNTIGTMSKLIRTRQGRFNLKDCYTLEDIDNGKYTLMSIKDCLDDFYQVIIDGNLLTAVKNGAIITNRWNQSVILFVDKDNNVLALYKTYDKDISMLKPWKML